ncbi:MAG: metallophosphoesterase [Thermomicrobiaceae bacterium]|nr:metallophosphoesterase [Thermomicrobiaceae bacterium]
MAVVLLLATTALLARPAGVGAAGTCATSRPSSGAYTVNLCLTAPTNGATVSGETTVSATVTVTGTSPKVSKLLFYLDGGYVITDFQSPYTFILPTARWVDAAHVLAAEAWMRDGFISSRTSITLAFSNGVTTPPTNTNTFTPSSGTRPAPGQPLVVAATGDGAGGEVNASKVTSLIASWNPNMFLYLGDVYDDGTPTEFRNWYGAKDGNQFFGQFAAITNPTVGNHEYQGSQAPGYFDYWDNIPHYYSFDAGGWHFISLDSTSNYGKTSTTSSQYQWLAQDLDAHANPCTLVFFHHPVFSIGPQGNTTSMNAIWSLLAQKGVDVVLTGHDHDYQRWVALDGSGNPSATGVREFVVGTGGHAIQSFARSDSRVAAKAAKYGALRLKLYSDHVDFFFTDINSTFTDQGSFNCTGTSDTTPPDTVIDSAPPTYTNSGDASLSFHSTELRSTFQCSLDGAAFTVCSSPQGYSGLAEGSHTFQVQAVDEAGNVDPTPASASWTVDLTAPSTPSDLSASAVSGTRVDLSWTASSDNVQVAGYDVYRNGSLLASLGPTTSYSDTAASPDTTYQYQVSARDAAGNASALSAAVSVTTPHQLVFADDFETGDLSRWTSNNGLAVQQQVVANGSYAAEAVSTSGTAAYATKTLSSTQADLYYRIRFNIVSQGANSVNLLRVRTGGNASLAALLVTSTGKLGIRNDVAGVTTTSSTVVSKGAWHEAQIHVRVAGSQSLIEVWLDGTKIDALTKTDSLGTTPVGRLQLGESQTGRIFDIAFDDVVADSGMIQ